MPAWDAPSRYSLDPDAPVSMDDFRPAPVLGPVLARPLTGSGSSVVDGVNSTFGREMNPTRRINNSLERDMPTSHESIGSGVMALPENLSRGASLLTSPTRRAALARDARELFPFANAVSQHGIGAVADDVVGSAEDSAVDTLKHPFRNFRQLPSAGGMVASHRYTPPEESARLRENVHERGRQTAYKFGAGMATGAAASYGLRSLVRPMGGRHGKALAATAAVALFATKTPGAAPEAGRPAAACLLSGAADRG